MATRSQTRRLLLQLVLGLVIAALSYGLYVSLTRPWADVERREELTRRTRARMDEIRTALIVYERAHHRFPGSLDTLVAFLRHDSLGAPRLDTLFSAGFAPDSLPFSPRTGRPFDYTVNDTGRIQTYLLKDPDSPDQIGTLEPDPTRRHAASWQ